jgi:hypothetical protein
MKKGKKAVEGGFNSFVKKLCSPENMLINVIGDIQGLNQPLSSWKQMVKNTKQGDIVELLKLPSSSKLNIKDSLGKCVIVNMPAIESSFALSVSKCN